MALDLTPFGFTPTESLVYEVLLTKGPGTGYAIARAASLARANAYGALEGLVAKGAARVGEERPKRYRPESPTTLVAKISNEQGSALEKLGASLSHISAPSSQTLIEIESVRSVLRLLTHDIGRAASTVQLVAPPDAYPLLVPALRRTSSAQVTLTLSSTGAVELAFAPVEQIPESPSWPGSPLVGVVDDRSAVIAGYQEELVSGHWSTAPTFVAAARLTIERLRQVS
jgi:sugar-specific transcriptional regulator TrmB